MRYRLMLLALLVSSANAGIYKTYDQNGNVIFTDVPSNDAQVIEEKPIATVPALPRNVIDAKNKPLKESNTVAAPLNYKITVSGVADQATIRKEMQAFNVGFEFEPPLAKAHHIKVSLDGKELGKDNFAPLIDPSKLERGQHRLELNVIDATQKMIQSQKIDFFIQQTTLNKPKIK